MDHDVIEEAGDFRVKLAYDDDHEFPDFIQSTVVPTNDRYQDYNDSYGYGRMLREIYPRRGSDVIERWLRIFHGVRAVQQVSLRDGTYLVLLTDDGQNYYGTPDDRVQECVDGDAETFRQWAEGEVYGWIVEKKVRWQKMNDNLVGHIDEIREDWEHVDSLWGMYGREYAEDEAREALEVYGEAAAA